MYAQRLCNRLTALLRIYYKFRIIIIIIIIIIMFIVLSAQSAVIASLQSCRLTVV